MKGIMVLTVHSMKHYVHREYKLSRDQADTLVVSQFVFASRCFGQIGELGK